MHNFIDASSLNLFKLLNVKPTFLKSDPSTWSRNENFNHIKTIVQSIHCVNDESERFVQMCYKINKRKLALNEEKFQQIIVTQSSLKNKK